MTAAEQQPESGWTPRVIDNQPREHVVIPSGKDSPKNSPENERWLSARIGAGPLSWVFLRGAAVVRVVERDPDDEARETDGASMVAPLSGRELSTRLADHYEVVMERKVGDMVFETEEWFPVTDCARALETPDRLPLVRPLKGTTHTPMVRPDGSLLTEPGYDEATGYLYLPSVHVPPVPDDPTGPEADAAVDLLRGMVDQFAWAGKHDEANFLGLLLTPLLRLLCPPPYKLGAIMARQPGSGKSLLNRIIREVHGGVMRSEMPHDEAELEKTISAILTCTTGAVVQFDNVSGTLRSSKFAGLLTTRDYSGRILGSTKEVPMVNDRLWTVTGNNLNFGGDLVRRTMWVTIDPQCPDPHKRTGFKLNLPEYVHEHRGDILHALLVLVRWWVIDGMPAEERSSDDYARWSAVVRGILKSVNIPGEFDHAESAQQDIGIDDEGWGEFLQAIFNVVGDRAWLVREVVEKLATTRAAPGSGTWDKPIPQYPELIDALPGELHEKFLRGGSTSISRSLGMWLRNRNGRFAGDLVCEAAGDDSHAKQKMWRIRSASGAKSNATESAVPF